MRLEIRKGRYSRDPYRIGLVHADGRFQELTHLHFDRQRDARPVLAALEALEAPWEVHPSQWPEALREQAAAIVEATPGYQSWREVVEQGPRAPGRRGR